MQEVVPPEGFATDLVKLLARRLEAHADRFLKQSADLSLKEWQLLVHIYEFRSQKLTTISDALAADLSDLVLTFDSLASLGYAKLHKEDLTVQTTPKGSEVYLSLLPLMEDRQQKILSNLTDTERAILRALLKKLLDRVSVMLDELPETTEERPSHN